MNHEILFKISKIFFIFFLAAIGSLFFGMGFFHPGSEIFWLLTLIGASCIPLVIAAKSRQFDPFEPVYPVALATLIYYGVVVVELIRKDSFWMMGINYRAEIPKVLFLAILAIGSFCIAYHGGNRGIEMLPKRPKISQSYRIFLHRWAYSLFCFFSGIFGLWILIAQVPLWSLWVFGGASYNAWKLEATGFQLGHFFSSIEALPACLLLILSTRAKRRWSFFSITLIIAVMFLFAGLGVRARLLLLFGSLFVLYYLERMKRPTFRQIILIGFIIFFFIVGLIGHFRDPEYTERGIGAYGLSEAWTNFIRGSDIATTTAVYVRWVPRLGYEWGKNILQVFLIPIPSAYWPGKYQFLGASPILEYLEVGSAASFFTEFYVSFGPAGVVLGMALLGWICRRVYNNYRLNESDPFAQIYLALLWAYLFHLYGRNLLSNIIYSAIYVFVPVWVSSWLVNRQHKNQRGIFYRRESE